MQGRYNEILAAGQYIEKNRDTREDLLFADRDNCPTAEMIRENAVEERVGEFLPWLIYYRDVYKPDGASAEEYLKSRQYIERILDDWVDIIPDEAAAPLNGILPKRWGKMTLKRRCAVFRELVSYYSFREFGAFLENLGWKRFMNHYGIQDRQRYAECEELTEDLLEVWEKLQQEPLPK